VAPGMESSRGDNLSFQTEKERRGEEIVLQYRRRKGELEPFFLGYRDPKIQAMGGGQIQVDRRRVGGSITGAKEGVGSASKGPDPRIAMERKPKKHASGVDVSCPPDAESRDKKKRCSTPAKNDRKTSC